MKLIHFYNHNSSQIELFSLLFGFINLCCRGDGGGGGKLSRAVYLAPHLGIMFIFLMLVPFVSNFLCMKLYYL